MTNKSTPRYVNNFGEYASLRGIDIMELPEGLRATSNEGQAYEIIEGSWRYVGESDAWVPDDDRSNCYRVDHDPLELLAPPFEYLGHIYAEGDEVEFLYGGRWIRTILRLDRDALRSSDAWDTDDYKPYILSAHGLLPFGIDGLRMYEPEVQAGSETLHTIDCHGIDPAMIQDYLDSYIAYREAMAKAEELAEKSWLAQDRQRDLFGHHSANQEALRGALDAVAQAAA